MFYFLFQAEDGIRDRNVTGVQTCALPICTKSMKGRSSHLGCSNPTTAAWFTLGWPTMAFSISIDDIHSPPDLITSLSRSVILMKQYSSMVATSPERQYPSTNLSVSSSSDMP